MNSCRNQELTEEHEGREEQDIGGISFLHTTSTSSQVPRETEIEIPLLVMILIAPKTLTKLPKAENDVKKSSIHIYMWFLTLNE